MRRAVPRSRSAASWAYVLGLLSACGEPGSEAGGSPYTHMLVRGEPRGSVEVSCPDDTAFRIGLARGVGHRVDLGADAETWVEGRIMRGDIVRRFVLPPGVTRFVARPERSRLEVVRGRGVAEEGLRFAVLVVDGFTTPVVVCPNDEARSGFAVSVGDLVPLEPPPPGAESS
jgi:hypothetical protein